MACDRSLKGDLARRFRDYRALPTPRVRGRLDLTGAEIDLYEEDGYLAGLVSKFLSDSPLEVDAIEIDRTIDSRLEQASTQSSAAQGLLWEFRLYRQRMRELAELLSQASGIPIRDLARKVSGDLRP